MNIENIDDVERYLQETKYFFGYLDSERNKLEKELTTKELERDDLLHEIELASLNVVERTRIYSRLEKTLKERRLLKDKIDYVNTLRGYTSKFITKGICAETEQVIQNIEMLKKNKETREYTPRILKDLKCAKKVKEDK